MAIPIAAIFGVATTIIDRLIPDKHANEKAKMELKLMEAKGDLAMMAEGLTGNLKINEQEAKHESIFVAGWRPFIGWACGVIFVYHGIIIPLIKYIAVFNGYDVNTLPEFDTAMFTSTLFGMLGIGGLRTYEKYKGVNHARKSPKYGKGSPNYEG